MKSRAQSTGSQGVTLGAYARTSSAKAALYARVSTNDMGQDVELQVGPLLEWLARLGYEAAI